MVWMLGATTCAGSNGRAKVYLPRQKRLHQTPAFGSLSYQHESTNRQQRSARQSSLDQWRKQCFCCGGRTMTVRAAAHEDEISPVWLPSIRGVQSSESVRASLWFDLKICSQCDFIFCILSSLACTAVLVLWYYYCCTFQFQFSAIIKPACDVRTRRSARQPPTFRWVSFQSSGPRAPR